MCPRVEYRMECPECKYPYSEAKHPLDCTLPHYLTSSLDVVEEEIFNYQSSQINLL